MTYEIKRGAYGIRLPAEPKHRQSARPDHVSPQAAEMNESLDTMRANLRAEKERRQRMSARGASDVDDVDFPPEIFEKLIRGELTPAQARAESKEHHAQRTAINDAIRSQAGYPIERQHDAAAINEAIRRGGAGGRAVHGEVDASASEEQPEQPRDPETGQFAPREQQPPAE